MVSLNPDKYAKRMEELTNMFAKGVFAHTDLKDMDITPPQFMVLRHLMDNENCTMSEISDAMDVTLGNMTGMVDRLIRDKYVERNSDPRDRRIVRVNITRKAVEKVKKILDHKIRAMKQMFGILSAKEMQDLFKILEKIASGIKK